MRQKVKPERSFTKGGGWVELNSDGIGTILTRDDYINNCKSYGFIDYDGYGEPVDAEGYTCMPDDAKNDFCYPSNMGEDLPENCTHVVWYNR